LLVSPWRAARRTAPAVSSAEGSESTVLPRARSSSSSSAASMEPPPCEGSARTFAAMFVQTRSGTASRQMGQSGETWRAEARQSAWKQWPQSGRLKGVARVSELMQMAQTGPPSSSSSP